MQVLEICKSRGIYYSKTKDRAKFYPIVDSNKFDIKLDDSCLYIDKADNIENLICGMDCAYFIDEEKILTLKIIVRMNKAPIAKELIFPILEIPIKIHKIINAPIIKHQTQLPIPKI